MVLPTTPFQRKIKPLALPILLSLTSVLAVFWLGNFLLSYRYSLILATQANRYLKEGSYSKAMANYQKAAQESVMNRKDNLSWYQFAQKLYFSQISYAKGEEEFKKNLFAKALADFEKVDPAYPKYSQANDYILKAQIELNLLAISITHYQNGVNLFNQGQWAASIAELNQVINLDPNYSDAQNKITAANQNLQQLSQQGSTLYPTIAQVSMSTAVGSSNQPLAVSTSFPANSTSLYAVLLLKNATAATAVSYTRYFSGNYVDSGQASPTTSNSSQYFYFLWKKTGNSYPKGTYQLKFYLNGYYTTAITYYIY